jgi:hypothetical protein
VENYHWGAMTQERERVRVLVLGGRLTPSLVGILSNPPDAIEFIVSSDTPSRESEARAILKKMSVPGRPMEERLPVSPLPLARAFDWQECKARCGEAAARHPDAEIVFDLTAAPKAISFAAYEFARRAGYDAIIVDTANERIVSVITHQAWPVRFPKTVREYLGLFNREYRPGGSFRLDEMSAPPERAREAARCLARQGRGGESALKKLAAFLSGNKGAPALSDDEYGLLAKLGEWGLLKAVSRQSDGRVTCRPTDNRQDENFLKGHWLEVFVREEARAQCNEAGQPVFDDCQSGFEIPEPGRVPRELDVGCLYHGQLIFCSCKTGNKAFKTPDLDELNGVGELVGSKFTTGIYVTNRPYAQ